MEAAVESISDYRSILREEFAIRHLRNPSYSLAAYARDLGLTLPMLSQVLHEKKGLSPESAARVAKKLDLAPARRTRFIASAQALHARSKTHRSEARILLRSIYSVKDRKLDHRGFGFRLGLSHLMVRELAARRVKGLLLDEIAAQLALSSADANRLVTECLAAKMVEEIKGRYRATDHQFFGAAGDDLLLRDIHRALIEKVLASISGASESRELNATLLSVSVVQHEKLIELVRRFHRDVTTVLRQESEEPRDLLVSLTSQILKLNSTGTST